MQAVQQIPTPADVVSFGETVLHLSAPRGVRLEEAETFHSYVGGSESNTLACLSRLHLKTIWLSALPLSPLGKRVAAELRRHGVDTSHVVWVDNARLGTFYSEEAPNPLGIHVYYDRANSACALLDPTLVDLTVVESARMLHLTGITPSLSSHTREVCARLLQRAREKQIPLSFDVNYRAKLWRTDEAVLGIEEACRQAELLFCTAADAAELWGYAGTPEIVLRQMARRFTTDGIPKTIVLTLGSDGAAQLQDDTYSIAPAFPTDGTARFGSGDAFAAGYLYAYLNGPLYQELHEEHGITPLAFGNALAALKRCIASHVASFTPAEVRLVLQAQEEIRFR